MADKHLDKVSFDFIRYSNCWEDADVLLAGLNLDSSSKVMSIASAGDNCFSLLSHSPKKVIAVDISEVQLFLVELKKQAISEMNRAEFLAFTGFVDSEDRIAQFERIKEQLSSNCQLYWESNLELIDNGIIHQGKFEQYFQLFKREVLPTVHNQTIVDELLRPKCSSAQEIFHDETWHTTEWEEMYRHFFGIEMMGSHGRDPEFLKHVTGTVPDIILKREMEHLRTTSAQRNYFLHYILKNEFDLDNLPHYVREENYYLIKANIDRLVLHNGLLDSAMNAHPNCTHFNLSDIFEYMDADLFRKVGQEIIDKSEDGAKFGYWNLMIPRYISREFPKAVGYLQKESENLKKLDKGYFYGNLIFEQKKAPLR